MFFFFCTLSKTAILSLHSVKSLKNTWVSNSYTNQGQMARFIDLADFKSATYFIFSEISSRAFQPSLYPPPPMILFWSTNSCLITSKHFFFFFAKFYNFITYKHDEYYKIYIFHHRFVEFSTGL